ncbi:MAG: hypothetical protein P8K08_00830 [Fuerstiella sp.]|jgi:hypothetical protein|nr:hypothetical protein [Fuerstiella sp.]
MAYSRVTGLCLLMFGVVGCQKDEAVVESKAVMNADVSRGLDGSPMSIRFTDSAPTPADMAMIRNMPSLQEIHGEAPGVDDEELALLAEMPSLSVLALTGTKSTGQAIEALAGAKALRSLDLSGAVGITDDGLKPLTDHAELRVLKLSRIPLTDAIADVITSLPKLEELSLDGTGITEVTIQRIAKQRPGLKSLSIGSAHITDGVISSIVKFSDLEILEITKSAMTGASLVALSDLAKLKLIRLADNVSMTNDAIMQLADVAALYHLDVTGTQFTAVGLGQKGFSGLNMLDANRTKVTDDTIPQFKGLPALYSVSLKGTEVTMSGVREHFAENHQTAFLVDE